MSGSRWIFAARIALPVGAPWLTLLVAPRVELIPVACFISLGLIPGVLWADRLLGATTGSIGTRLAFGVALALVVFGLPATLAGRLHTSFDAFVISYAVTWIAAVVGALVRRAPESPELEIPKPEPSAPEPWLEFAGRSRPAALLLGIGGLLVLGTYALGVGTPAERAWLPLWIGTAIGVAAMVTILALGSRTPISAGPDASGEDAGRGFTLGAWLIVAGLSAFLMRVAFEAPEAPLDDVTHVSRAVDFLAGGPLDRFEPSLGEEIPLDAEFTGPTTALLVATLAQAAGLECAAIAHTWLPPIFVLFAIASLVAMFSMLLPGQRWLVPVAVASALAVLAHTGDNHRSVAAFVIERALLPKSAHLALLMPLQLATLVCVALRPTRNRVLIAILVATSAHLVHPWGTVLGALWWASAALYALGFARGSWRALATLGIAIATLGLLQKLAGELGPEVTVVRTPTIPLELLMEDDVATRLDVDGTLGDDRLLRLGVLLLPWMLLGAALLGHRLLFVFGIAALLCAYWTPLFDFQALVVPRSLLWRTRWMVPSLACAGLFAVFLTRAAASLGGSRGRATRAALGALALPLTLFLGTAEARFELGGDFEYSSKLHEPAHRLAEHFGNQRATLVAPVPPVARVAAELCQLVPNVRVLVTTAHVLRWYAGDAEFKRRAGLIEAFYQGQLGGAGYQALTERYGVDHVLVDASYGRPKRQRQILLEHGWTRALDLGRFELWRRP